MIPKLKLLKLSPKHRIRKIAVILKELEEALRNGKTIDEAYAKSILGLLIEEELPPDEFLSSEIKVNIIKTLGETLSFQNINVMRNNLLQALSLEPADWDMFDPTSGKLDRSMQTVFKGTALFLDDLRSPFNVGSLFRSADAFGIEKLYLSPFTAAPEHVRAQRSSMGAQETVPYERLTYTELAQKENIFCLELGGTPIEEFVFPRNGIAIIGSEELGVSPEAQKLCSYGRVTIPMYGAKASINAGVAAGILMNAWAQSLVKEQP